MQHNHRINAYDHCDVWYNPAMHLWIYKSGLEIEFGYQTISGQETQNTVLALISILQQKRFIKQFVDNLWAKKSHRVYPSNII